MSCNGNCGCSCKKEISDLKSEILGSVCRKDTDLGEYGLSVRECIEQGACDCRLRSMISDDDLTIS